MNPIDGSVVGGADLQASVAAGTETGSRLNDAAASAAAKVNPPEGEASGVGLLRGAMRIRRADGSEVEAEVFAIGRIALKNIPQDVKPAPSGAHREVQKENACWKFVKELLKHHCFAKILENLHHLTGG